MTKHCLFPARFFRRQNWEELGGGKEVLEVLEVCGGNVSHFSHPLLVLTPTSSIISVLQEKKLWVLTKNSLQIYFHKLWAALRVGIIFNTPTQFFQKRLDVQKSSSPTSFCTTVKLLFLSGIMKPKPQRKKNTLNFC